MAISVNSFSVWWICCLICIHTKLSFNYFWFDVSFPGAKSNVILFFLSQLTWSLKFHVKTRSAWTKSNHSSLARNRFTAEVQHKGYKIIFQVRLLIRKGLQQIDAFHFQIISRQQVHQWRWLKRIREKKNWLDFIWRVFA